MNEREQRGSRPTIGFLVERAAGLGDYQNAIWAAVVDAACELDVNCLCFIGGSLQHSPQDAFESQRNVLYDLVAAENVDGVIVSATLGSYASPQVLQDFCDRHRSLPMICIAASMEGLPAALVDNGSGMRDAVVHLAEAHERRRIAFICGPENNEEAAQRYRAYIDALAECGLSFDSSLVAPGDFLYNAGTEAIRLLVDERKADFEAVVAANDNMAFGAMDALRTRGLHVPRDVAVVGFDDTRRAGVNTPPLTTVQQPIRQLGRRAVEMLLGLLVGEQVPEHVILPTKLVVRQSCGCLGTRVVQAAAAPVGRGDGVSEVSIAAWRAEFLGTMAQTAWGLSEGISPAWLEQLVDGLVTDLQGESEGAFLSALGAVLRQVVEAGESVITWQGIVSALRRSALPYLDGDALLRANDLWQQARVMTGEMARRVQTYWVLHAEQQTSMLLGMGASLITTFDVEKLVDTLADRLPRLGIPGVSLSLYERHPDLAEGGQRRPAEWSRLMLVYDTNGYTKFGIDGVRFPSKQLMPEEMWPQDRAYRSMVEPLCFQDQQLGYMLFEVGPREGGIYDALRDSISSALYGALLLREQEEAKAVLERAHAEMERQVEEQAAQLKQEITERVRTQAANLRLQQEVIEAQQQAIQDLSTPIIPVMEGVVVMPLIGSIDTLRARDVMRRLLEGIREYQASVVILDLTGVAIVDSGVASHLNKTVQAARLRGARTIVTGISDAVAEIIVDLGIDWSGVETRANLQTGLQTVLRSLRVARAPRRPAGEKE